jgi:hypothetical protein
MSDQAPQHSRRHRLRRDPNPMNLSDLMVLVAGFAITLPLEATVRKPWFTRLQLAEPLATLVVTGEYVSKFNIALIIVVLAQHFRSSRMFRPAEWLIITSAMLSVHWHLVHAGGMDWVAHIFGWEQPTSVSSGVFAATFRAWCVFGIVCLVTVVTALISLRRTMPHGVRLLLLVMLPLLAMWGPALLFRSELQGLMLGRWSSVPYVRLMMMAFVGLSRLPEHVIICLAFAATLKNLARKHCPAWSWVERAGFGAALITATAEGAMIMAEATRTIPVVAERLAYLTIWAAGWLVAFAVADVLVRSFGDLWKCWTEPQPALA